MNQLNKFEEDINKYDEIIYKLLGNKYGITSEEFIIKTINAIKKTPNLLKCNSSSLFGSILYFAEIGLPFNTPEGFGTILPFSNNGVFEATPIIGYKGLIEIAYRNPKIKSISISSVYDVDDFDFEYGTSSYLKHKPNILPNITKNLIAVYAIAKLENIEPLFVVVSCDDLKKIQNISKSGSSKFSAYNNGLDVFNIMQSKVAIKLLFKMLPKTNNETLIKVLDDDNEFDYKNNKIRIINSNYKIIESEKIKYPKDNLNINIEHSDDFLQK